MNGCSSLSFNLDSAVKESQVVQMAESAKDFSFFARDPGTVRVSTRNEKAKAISVICAAWRTATAESRFNVRHITGEKEEEEEE